MGCSPFRAVSALAWVLQLPQSVLLSRSNFFQDCFSSHIPRNVPYHLSPFLNINLFTYLVFLLCILILWFLLRLLMCLLSLLDLALSKIHWSKGSLCSSDWLRISWIDCYFRPVWWWLELTVTGTELFMASSHTDYTCSPLLLKQNSALSDCSASVISLPNLTHYTYEFAP